MFRHWTFCLLLIPLIFGGLRLAENDTLNQLRLYWFDNLVRLEPRDPLADSPFALAALDEASLIHLLKKKYPTIDNIFANYHPVFLCDQIRAICDFEGIDYQMRPDFIDRAWENLYVREEAIVH